jgi:hypothetical protein
MLPVSVGEPDVAGNTHRTIAVPSAIVVAVLPPITVPALGVKAICAPAIFLAD